MENTQRRARSATPKKRHDAQATVNPGDIPGARPARLPEFIAPALATLVDAPPAGDEWAHEIKFDGYRILCRIDNGRVSLFTREAQDWTHRFSSIAEAAKKLPVSRAFLDGEVVALESDGTTNFQLLQNSLNQGDAGDIVYFAFDLLYLDGFDLTPAPLLARKQALERLLKNTSRERDAPIRYSEHWIGRGEALLAQTREMGLEGVIAKRVDRPYRSGRSRDWLKIKCLQNQEFVIGGFTDPAGARIGLGALLLGVYDGGKNLRYAGRVGTGFNEKSLRDLRTRLDARAQNAPPFANPPRGRDARGVHWVKPELACEVAFTGWTRDGVLRHPSFKGLREDKPAAKIHREKAAPARR